MMHFLIHSIIGFFLVLSVRDISPSSNTGVVIDVDGNEYKITLVGDQWWFAQNLSVTRYSNGDDIPLIADTESTLCESFGAIKEKNMYGRKVMGIERSTFLIDGNGVVVRAWRGVKVPGHVQEVLEAARAL